MGSPRQDGSFWEVGEPWRVLRRIENGNRSCDELMAMVQERADVELRYANSLRQWASKWENSLDKGSEYGSVLTAWRAVLQEASAIAKIHEDCRMQLTGDDGPYYNVYKWKSEHYHQSGSHGLRETAEARDGFAAAQKGYAKLLSKVHRAKKAYHNASVAAYRARRFADDQAARPDVSPGASWKLRQRADALALDRERLKQAYLRRVLVCNVNGKERYVQNMTSVFDRWQDFERQRLERVQSQLHLFVRNLNTHSGTGMSQTYQGILNQVWSAEPSVDVEEWGRQYGTGSQANWPKYEEIDPRASGMDTGLPLELDRREPTGETTDDIDIADEFTTDEFDSEQDTDHRHTQQRLQPRLDHAQQGVHRPYRTHQHEELPDFSVGKRHHPQDRFGHQQVHQQRHLEPHYYSQNEDLSERWLEERRGGRGGRWDGGGRWEGKGHHHPSQRRLHHDDTIYHHRDTMQEQMWNQDDQSYEPGDRWHEGQRSQRHRRIDMERHHKKERSQYANDHEGSKGHQQRYDQGHSSSVYDTLATSQSQVSLPHGNRPSSTALEQQVVGRGYHGNYGYHGKSESDDSLAIHQVGTSPEEICFKKDESKVTRATSHTVSQGAGQLPSQTVPRVDRVTSPQASSQTPAARGTSHAQRPDPTQTRPDPTQTRPDPTQTRPDTTQTRPDTTQTQPDTTQTRPDPTQTRQHDLRPSRTARRRDAGGSSQQSASQAPPQTYIERRNGAEGDAERRERARRALQPTEGERLVRALYDFKPATRDEMALKQSEYLVQIGEHLSNGWAYGRKAGAMGHFPASYVQ